MSRYFLIVCLILSACSGDESESYRSVHPLDPALALGSNRPQVEAEQSAKALSASPHGPYLEPADWEAAKRFTHGDANLFAESEREKLSAIRVPVLAPARPEWLLNAQIVHNQHWYTISSRQEQITFYIKGSTLGFRTELTVPHPRKEDIEISRSHGIVTASFRRFDASYHLDVECTAPERDPRCADDKTVRALVHDLVVYGGSP